MEQSVGCGNKWWTLKFAGQPLGKNSIASVVVAIVGVVDGSGVVDVVSGICVGGWGAGVVHCTANGQLHTWGIKYKS